MDESTTTSLYFTINSYSFFEDFKLVVHEVYEDLVLVDFLLLDNLDSALYICLLMLSPKHFPEGACTERARQLIMIENVVHFLEALVVFERDQTTVTLLSLAIHVYLVLH